MGIIRSHLQGSLLNSQDSMESKAGFFVRGSVVIFFQMKNTGGALSSESRSGFLFARMLQEVSKKIVRGL